MLTIAQETGLGFDTLALVLGAVGTVMLEIKDGMMKRKATGKADATARSSVPLAGVTPEWRTPPRQ